MASTETALPRATATETRWTSHTFSRLTPVALFKKKKILEDLKNVIAQEYSFKIVLSGGCPSRILNWGGSGGDASPCPLVAMLIGSAFVVVMMLVS